MKYLFEQLLQRVQDGSATPSDQYFFFLFFFVFPMLILYVIALVSSTPFGEEKKTFFQSHMVKEVQRERGTLRIYTWYGLHRIWAFIKTLNS